MMRYKQAVTTLHRASSRTRVPCLVARYMTTNSTNEVPPTRNLEKENATIALGPPDMLRSYMLNLRLRDSLDPIPFTDGIPVVPINDAPGGMMHKKVSIIGCGQVGMGIAFALLNQTAAGTIALVDMNASKLEAEAKDLEQGSGFHEHVRILAGTDYEVTAHSHLVIVTAGVAQKPGESRLSLMAKNVAIMKNIIPQVLAHSPNAAICIVSNPCDIMTAVAAKIAGSSVPAGRIFGSGTCLDSSRLQSLISKTLEIDARAVQGYVVGEHGDNSVALWSSVRVGGVHMLQPGHEPEEIHKKMHHEIIKSAYDIIEKKGYTNWAVGLTGAYIGKAVLNDERNIVTVSTCVRGMHGIEEDVFLSMPCSVGAHGVRRIINTPMTTSEKDQFVNAAKAIWNIQKGVWDQI
jgi:L-lactate dehydrogenase